MTQKNDRLKALLVSLIFVGCVTASHAKNNETKNESDVSDERRLTPKECSAIDQFENDYGRSFSSVLGNLVTHRGYCVENSDYCKVAPQQRADDYFVFFRELDALGDEERTRSIVEFGVRTLKNIGKYTGISPIFEPPEGTHNYIYIVFVDPEIVSGNRPEFIAKRIARPEFGTPEVRTRVFEEFLSNNSPCQGFASHFEDRKIRDVHLWFRSDLSDRQIRKCVLGRSINAMGIEGRDSEKSILNWGDSDGSDYIDFGELNSAFLKVYYRANLESPIGEKKIELSFDEIQRNDCF